MIEIERHIHFINPTRKTQKTRTGKELAEKLFELARSLEDNYTRCDPFRGVVCTWQDGVSIEIYTTRAAKEGK